MLKGGIIFKTFVKKKSISYFCVVIKCEMRREVIFSPEYIEFEEKANQRAKEKLQYAVAMLEMVTPIPTKFVKKLVDTDFYEMRISVDNEIRVIIFSADNENINVASTVVLLNGFVKKSTKDYDREVKKAISILRKLL